MITLESVNFQQDEGYGKIIGNLYSLLKLLLLSSCRSPLLDIIAIIANKSIFDYSSYKFIQQLSGVP